MANFVEVKGKWVNLDLVQVASCGVHDRNGYIKFVFGEDECLHFWLETEEEASSYLERLMGCGK